jgi:sortase A
MKSAARFTLSLLVVLGIGLALWPVGQWAYARWNQQQLQDEWAQSRRETPKKTQRSAAPQSRAEKTSRSKPQARTLPRTRIVSADMDLNAVVLSGFDEATLRRGPGHMPTSALPGEAGNCVIAAHRNVYGSYFYNVDKLYPGAQITLQTPDSDYNYTVISVQTVIDNDVSVLRPPADPNIAQLTLITCFTQRTTSRICVIAQMTPQSQTH